MKLHYMKHKGTEIKKAAAKLLSRRKAESSGEGMACEVVRDLIPLYADGVASSRTVSFVRAHIAVCPDCADYFHSVVKAAKSNRMSRRQGRIGVGGFAGVAGKIRRRRAIYAAGVAIALITLLGLNLYTFLSRGDR